MMTELLRLRLPANAAFATVARESVVSLARGLGFSEDERAGIRLAVGEACNNAVDHAGGRAMFTLQCFQDDDALVVDVESRLPDAAPNVPVTMPSAEAEHGRGRALMEALSDHVEYENIAAGFRVRLRKSLPRTINPAER